MGPGIDSINGWAAGAATTGFGLHQYQKGKQMERANGVRPMYVIPAEVKASLTMAEQQALEGLPEEQKRQYLSNLQRGANYSLTQQQTRKGGLAGLAALNEGANQGYLNLAAQDAVARYQRQQNVYAQMENLANYKGQAYQLNQLNPWYENTAKAQAMMGAGIQNIGNSFQIAQGKGGNYGGQNPSAQTQYNAPQVNPYSQRTIYQTPMAQNQVTTQPTVGYNVPQNQDAQVGQLQGNGFNYSSFNYGV